MKKEQKRGKMKKMKTDRCKVVVLTVIALCLLVACHDGGTEEYVSEQRAVSLFVSGNRFEADADKEPFDTVFFASSLTTGRYEAIWPAVVHEGGTADFTVPRYYPYDNSALYLRGFFPAASLYENALSFNLTGAEDVRVSEERQGRLTDMFWNQEKSFTFNHLLTQLVFSLQTNYQTDSCCLQTLSVSGTRLQAILLPRNDTLTFSGPPVDVVAYDLSEQGDTLWLSEDKTIALPCCVLVELGASLSLNLTLTENGKIVECGPLPIVFHETDGKSQAGTSYRVTVTVSPRTDMQLVSVSVVDWERIHVDGIIDLF